MAEKGRGEQNHLRCQPQAIRYYHQITWRVFYTSDGRDIEEYPVASTKAFYAQIIAQGQLLGLFFAQILGSQTDNDIAAILTQLESQS